MLCGILRMFSPVTPAGNTILNSTKMFNGIYVTVLSLLEMH